MAAKKKSGAKTSAAAEAARPKTLEELEAAVAAAQRECDQGWQQQGQMGGSASEKLRALKVLDRQLAEAKHELAGFLARAGAGDTDDDDLILGTGDEDDGAGGTA